MIRIFQMTICVVAFWVFACKDHGHSGHGHEAEVANDEAAHELPAQSITVYAEKTELFMEYEPLVVGKESRFAAHLTTLSDFKAVTQGVLTLRIERDKGKTIEARADGPSSPGIFRFKITPEEGGEGRLFLAYKGQGIEDTITAGDCRLFVDENAAREGLPEEGEGGGIAYTKEQQWKTDFANIEVNKRSLQPSVRATGEIRPVSGAEARITAPTRGRLSIRQPFPLPGTTVKKGRVLATVTPYYSSGGDPVTLDADVQTARVALEAAKAQQVRLERLLEKQAVSERRVEEARAEVQVAEATLSGANGRLRQYRLGAAGTGAKGPGAFMLRSTIDGTLVEVNATDGDSVEEGRLLFVVVNLEKLWLTARVFEPEIPKVETAETAWFTLEGYDEPFIISADNGRIIEVGRVIDPTTRTVPVIFEMNNPGGRLRVGQFAKVFIAVSAQMETLAIPASAILDEGGKSVVYVQLEGERFERRVVDVGIRDREWAEVLSGVREGERVVTVGAYEIRLAAASGAIPEHGHVH